MRLPSESELSREQREVCQAPLNGTTLVLGPPGSGKTVVAVFRLEAARKLGVEARVAVHNRVLSRYTGLEGTFHTWFKDWWCRATGSPARAIPRVESDWGYRPVDYAETIRKIAGQFRDRVRTDGHWGHLILDEAQDFPVEAHQLLNLVPMVVFADAGKSGRPSLTILADENQRITESNATIAEIMHAHYLTSDDVYTLTKNYRNTREIAKVARFFHVGAATGVPELPTRRGNKPQFVRTSGVRDAAERIANYALMHPDHEIGVLVQYKPTRSRFFSELCSRLSVRGVRVQQYDGSPGNADGLVFDKPGTVTVLCYSSAKGLEFDAVFLPELQTLRVDGEAEDFAKMNLYVMCSRARTHLVLMVDRDTPRHSPLWRILPSEDDRRRLFDIV